MPFARTPGSVVVVSLRKNAADSVYPRARWKPAARRVASAMYAAPMEALQSSAVGYKSASDTAAPGLLSDHDLLYPRTGPFARNVVWLKARRYPTTSAVGRCAMINNVFGSAIRLSNDEL